MDEEREDFKTPEEKWYWKLRYEIEVKREHSTEALYMAEEEGRPAWVPVAKRETENLMKLERLENWVRGKILNNRKRK